MLGSKTGKRDIDRGISDIQKGITDIKAAFTKDPAKQIAMLEKQRERHLEESRKYRQKAKGMFNGPARLRMAEAAEAKADALQVRIDKLREAHGIAPAPGEATERPVEERLQKAQDLLDAGVITQDEYAEKRAAILAEL